MAQAVSKLNIVPTTDQVASGLSDMENPLCVARNLAYAALMMASSDQMPEREGAALDALADTLVSNLNTLIDERKKLWLLARSA
jgi:hypothetical protein